MNRQSAYVRFLFHPALNDHEKKAALDGARSFHAFSVGYDCLDVGRRSLRDMHPVRRGEKLHGIITENRTVISLMDLACESPWALIFNKRMFGAAITTAQLHEREEPEGGEGMGAAAIKPMLGLSFTGAAAVISVFALRSLDAETEALTIEAAVRHELGHVFGLRGHCTGASCIMQANENYLDFVERFAKARLGFCTGCEAKVRGFLGAARPA